MNTIGTWLPDEAAIFLGLTLAQRGAFASIRQLYFLTEGPVSETAIKAACPVLTPEDEKAIAYVLSRFYIKKQNCWVHLGYQKYVDEALRKRAMEAAAGRKNAQSPGTEHESVEANSQTSTQAD